jgi:oligopeptide/dipeptide ABC transporter ATP-binding protein
MNDRQAPPANDRAASPTIEAIGVTKHFRPSRFSLGDTPEMIRAVDGVDLTVYPGEIFGLVGESGCGKSTLGRLLVGLLRPTDGVIRLEGRNILDESERSVREVRRIAQMVFQDPYGSLNPSFKISTSLKEAYRLRKGRKRDDLQAEMKKLMDYVGLRETILDRYPHQLSGGQRQRVVTARALATGARVLILDEPTSALDVSVQSQILNLLIDLKQELGLTYVFISHDLEVIRYLCDRMAVMYLGKIVEVGNTQDVLDRPRHPYTEGLLAAVPRRTDRGTRLRPIIEGEIPDPTAIPSGCRFHPRCRYAQPDCRTSEPRLVPQKATRRPVACFYPAGKQPTGDTVPALQSASEPNP